MVTTIFVYDGMYAPLQDNMVYSMCTILYKCCMKSSHAASADPHADQSMYSDTVQ